MLTSVVIGRPRTKPQAQLKKVIVVSHDFRVATLMAIMPVMMQCQMHSCQQNITIYWTAHNINNITHRQDQNVQTTNTIAPQFHPQIVHKYTHVFSKWYWSIDTVLVVIYRPGYHPVYNHCRFKNSNIHNCIYTDIPLLRTVLGMPWLRQCLWPLTTEAPFMGFSCKWLISQAFRKLRLFVCQHNGITTDVPWHRVTDYTPAVRFRTV